MNDFVQNLAMTSQPAEEPVTLAQAKLQCRVDVTDTTEDALLSALIPAARQYCEKETRRAFVSRSYALKMNRFPYIFPIAYYPFYTLERMPNQLFGRIYLPKPPLLSVDSISYVDDGGTTRTLDPSKYQVDLGGELQGCITPAFGLLFPSTRYQMDAVTVNFTAGYGPASAVPAGIGQAMLLCIGHWYRNREAVSESSFSVVPLSVRSLLSPFSWGSYA